MPNTLKDLALRTSAAGWSSWSLANVGLAVLLFGMAGCQTQPPPRLTPQLRETTVHPQGKARIVEYGTLVFRSTHMTSPDFDEPTNFNNAYRLQSRVDVPTNRIAAIPGNRFGYLFEITDLPPQKPVRLKGVIKHPPRRLPNGRKSTESVDEFPSTLPQDGIIRGYAALSFDKETDMLPGEWSLELWHEDTKLLSKQFIVFSPHPLPASLSASGEPEFVWGPMSPSGIQIGLGLFEPGMMGVKIRGDVSGGNYLNENEKRLYPTLKLQVRGADQSWMPLKLRNLPAKPPSPNTNAIVVLGTDGSLTLNLTRLGNNILPIRLLEYEWPTFPNGDVEIQVELDFDSSEQPNGSRNTLKSGILVVPATALSVSRPPASTAVVGPVSAKILGFGTYWPKGVGRRVLDPEIANHSLLQHEQIVFEQQTNNIPKVLNARFGYSFEIGGLRPSSRVKLTCMTTHPPIHAADGRVVTQFQTHSQRTVGLDGKLRGFTGYMFEDKYELVTGKWMMEVFLDGERLLQKTFNVFDPRAGESQEP